jgi:hypothetical protein
MPSAPFKGFSSEPYPKGSVTQYFGENTDLYSTAVCHSGMCMTGGHRTYTSYFDKCPMTQPDAGNIEPGISSFLTIYSPFSSRQIQKKKSHGLGLLRLNTHTPLCSPTTGFPRLFFRLYNLQTLTSIISPFLSRSHPRENGLCCAPRKSADHISHLNPTPVSVFQNSSLFLRYEAFVPELLKYQARLQQLVEQYFGRWVSLLHQAQITRT